MDKCAGPLLNHINILFTRSVKPRHFSTHLSFGTVPNNISSIFFFLNFGSFFWTAVQNIRTDVSISEKLFYYLNSYSEKNKKSQNILYFKIIFNIRRILLLALRKHKNSTNKSTFMTDEASMKQLFLLNISISNNSRRKIPMESQKL